MALEIALFGCQFEVSFQDKEAVQGCVTFVFSKKI